MTSLQQVPQWYEDWQNLPPSKKAELFLQELEHKGISMTEKGNVEKFDVDYLRRFVGGASVRISKAIQHEVDAINNMGFKVSTNVGEHDVFVLSSNQPKQFVEVKLNVSL